MNGRVGYIMGWASILAGIGVWGLAIVACISWVIFCFGTVIIGLLLLFFAPHLLLFPLALNVIGTGLIRSGVRLIDVQREDREYEERLKDDELSMEMEENARRLEICRANIERLKKNKEEGNGI